MKKKTILALGLAALLTSCGYSEDYDVMEYLTGPDDSCADKCGLNQYCINGVCSDKQPGGNECYDHNHCQSGYCADFDRDAKDYVGVCKSFGGQSCRVDDDCIFGKCNDGICACSTHDGCDGQSLCDNGTCLPLVECPNEKTKNCIIVHDSVPNISWASGNNIHNASAVDPYFGNMITLTLPIQYAYSCGMLLKTLAESILGDQNTNTNLDKTTVAKLYSELSLRSNSTCFSMELPVNSELTDDSKPYPIAALTYKITPNDGIKDVLATNDGKYSIYFKALVNDSGLMETSRFQMEIGNMEIGNNNNKVFESQAQATFPTQGNPKELIMKFPQQSSDIYNVYFKGYSSEEKLAVDTLLSKYCNKDFTYINNDNKPRYNGNDVGCKTVKFFLTSLRIYIQVIDNIPTADPTASVPPKDKRSQELLNSKK